MHQTCTNNNEDLINKEIHTHREESKQQAPDAEIPSEKEILEFGSMQAFPEESCRNFYDYYQGNNLWLNQHGRPLDWRVKLRGWVVRDRQNQSTINPNGQGNTNTAGKAKNPAGGEWLLLKQLETVNAEIKAIEGRASHTATNMIVENADRDEYRLLKTRRKEIKEQLGLRKPKPEPGPTAAQVADALSGIGIEASDTALMPRDKIQVRTRAHEEDQPDQERPTRPAPEIIAAQLERMRQNVNAPTP